MTEAASVRAPVGVRPAGHGHLRWVAASSLELTPGDRVAVRDGNGEWPGEVVVPSDRILEWPSTSNLPEVVRLLRPDEWPAEPARAGHQLYASLDLPTAARRPR